MMPILKGLLGFLGLGGVSLWGGVIIAGAIALAGWGGWRVASWKENAERFKIYQDWQDSVALLDKAHRAEQRKVLADLQTARAKTDELSRRIPELVDLDGCRLTPDGVRRINAEVRRRFPATGISNGAGAVAENATAGSQPD